MCNFSVYFVVFTLLQGAEHDGILRSDAQHPQPIRRLVLEFLHRTDRRDPVRYCYDVGHLQVEFSLKSILSILTFIGFLFLFGLFRRSPEAGVKPVRWCWFTELVVAGRCVCSTCLVVSSASLHRLFHQQLVRVVRGWIVTPDNVNFTPPSDINRLSVISIGLWGPFDRNSLSTCSQLR